MSANTQCTMAPKLEKHYSRPAQINGPYGSEIPLSQQQSQAKKLVPFASLLAISGTFNSLSKVLFIFPSRYLFAIGLRSIFSFRRKLPPILRTTSKVRDSKKPHRMLNSPRETGFSPSVTSFSKETYAGITLVIALKTTIPKQASDLQVELFPVQSPLLRESYSFSFPPLTYMLKFSR